MYETNKLDVVVVGAGLVGAVLAYSLAELGINVKLCDRIDITSKPDLSRFERPISLNWYTRCLLYELGLWQNLQEGAIPITKVYVSVANSFGGHMFTAQQTDALGYVLSYVQLQQTLWDKVLEHDKIEFIDWEKYNSFTQDDASVTIDYVTKGGVTNSITEDCCFAVDGVNSYIRENFLNIDTVDSTTLCCMAADVEISTLEVAAYQRMTQQGTLALIPTDIDKKYRLMWSMSKEQAAELKELDTTLLVARVNKMLGRKFGCIDTCTRKVFLDLPWRLAQQQYKNNILLMGNAAHTIYPAAAQGFNLGMQDISILLYGLTKYPEQVSVKKWFSDYVSIAEPLQRKKINFVRVQHNFNKSKLGQSLMAKFLGFSDLLRPMSNALAASYMGTNIDGKYLDELRRYLAMRKLPDVI